MARDLAILEREAMEAFSLPDSLRRSLSGLTVNYRETLDADGHRIRAPMATIEQSRAPSQRDRQLAVAKISVLDSLQSLRSVDYSMAKVTEMLLCFPQSAMSESVAKARAKGFIAALEDLPTWAVAEACRRYIRREAGEDHNYNFAPSPPVLRKIARDIHVMAAALQDRLQRLLDAEVVPDPRAYTEDERAANVNKLAKLLGSFRPRAA